MIIVNMEIMGGDEKTWTTGAKTGQLKEADPYLSNLRRLSSSETGHTSLPRLPYGGKGQAKGGHLEAASLVGTWIPGHPADMYGDAKGDQKNRDAAAFFTSRYEAATERLRAKTFADSTMGVPLEYFRFERIIIDECHEAACRPTSKGGGEAGAEQKRRMGTRELLGLAQPSLDKRPLRCRLATWGLSGTPMLNNEARTTELAALCGGTYVCGAAKHWRKMERASGRDIFVEFLEVGDSQDYRALRRVHAQSYLTAGVQRNRAVEWDKDLVEMEVRMVEVRMSADTAQVYERIVHDATEAADAAVYNTALKPVLGDEEPWSKIVACTNGAKERQECLRSTLNGIHADDPTAKIVIFAESGAALATATEALEHQGGCLLRGRSGRFRLSSPLFYCLCLQVCATLRTLLLFTAAAVQLMYSSASSTHPHSSVLLFHLVHTHTHTHTHTHHTLHAHVDLNPSFAVLDEHDDALKERTAMLRDFSQVDITAEDAARPRVLLLSFDHAAGHNFQYACCNVVMVAPLCRESIASTAQEQQAICRVRT